MMPSGFVFDDGERLAKYRATQRHELRERDLALDTIDMYLGLSGAAYLAFNTG